MRDSGALRAPACSCRTGGGPPGDEERDVGRLASKEQILRFERGGSSLWLLLISLAVRSYAAFDTHFFLLTKRPKTGDTPPLLYGGAAVEPFGCCFRCCAL